MKDSIILSYCEQWVLSKQKCWKVMNKDSCIQILFDTSLALNLK